MLAAARLKRGKKMIKLDDERVVSFSVNAINVREPYNSSQYFICVCCVDVVLMIVVVNGRWVYFMYGGYGCLW